MFAFDVNNYAIWAFIFFRHIKRKTFPPSLGSATRNIFNPLFHCCVGPLANSHHNVSDHTKILEAWVLFSCLFPTSDACLSAKCVSSKAANYSQNQHKSWNKQFCFWWGVVFVSVFCVCGFDVCIFARVCLSFCLTSVKLFWCWWQLCCGASGVCVCVSIEKFCQSFIFLVESWFPSSDEFWVSVSVWYLLLDKRQSLCLFTCLFACPSVLPPLRLSVRLYVCWKCFTCQGQNKTATSTNGKRNPKWEATEQASEQKERGHP